MKYLIQGLLVSFGLGSSFDKIPLTLSKKQAPQHQILLQTTFATEEDLARVNAQADPITNPLDGGVVVHQKAAGSGYIEGSPLYDEQQAQRKSNRDPKHNKADELPISTTVKCILNLLIQYFLIYTALAVVHSWNQIQGTHGSRLKQILLTLAKSVNYAPMLCVLFLGTRMRAIQLTQGDTEKYELPQGWVQNAMQIASWSVLATALVSLLTELVGGEGNQSQDPKDKPLKHEGGLMSVLSIAKFVCMAGLYLGFVVVVVGAIVMPAPEELWKHAEKSAMGTRGPPVSPAVNNTINLAAQYFIVVLFCEIYRTKIDIARSQARVIDEMDKRWEDIWSLCAETVTLAPMLCVMFIAVRQRALAMDPQNGNPQKWAQTCMFLCSYAVLLQTILVVVVPVMGGKVSRARDAVEGDITFKFNNPHASMALEYIRWILMICLYVSFICIAISPFLLTPKEGKAKPIAPALCNVLLLVALFFLVYLFQWISICYANHGGSAVPKQIFTTAKQCVMYCPMLAILFVATRMRSDQIGLIAGFESAPPRFAQEAMHLSTWALVLQVLMVIICGCIWSNAEVDSDGNPLPSQGSIWGKIIEVIRYVFLILFYGGIVVVLYGVFTMDVDAVNVAKRQPGLIPGVEIPPLGDVAQSAKSFF